MITKAMIKTAGMTALKGTLLLTAAVTGHIIGTKIVNLIHRNDNKNTELTEEDFEEMFDNLTDEEKDMYARFWRERYETV